MHPPALVSLTLAIAVAAGATEDRPWPRHAIDDTLAGADGTRLADVNGDGRPDFAVGWEQSGQSRVYLHPGASGNPRQPWRFLKAGPAPEVEDANLVDLDGDGRLDVLSCTDGHRRVIAHFAPPPREPMADWRTEVFPTAIVPDQNWMFSVVADVNRDGRPDILLGGKSTGGTVARIGWLESPRADRRDLSRWRFHTVGDVGWTMTLRPHDFNDDGWPDLLVSDRRPEAGLQGLRWLENPGDSERPWRNHPIGANGREVMFSDLADLTGDGRAEILTVTHDRHILWYEQGAEGTWREHAIDWPDESVGRIGKAVSVGDLNSDGRAEIVVSTEGAAGRIGIFALSYSESHYDAQWRWLPVAGLAGEKFDLAVLVDLDADGDLDVLATEEANNSRNPGDSLGVVWFENPGRAAR